jgi:hypothetical protein
MSEVLSPYYQRAPRYTLLPQDQCLILVAGPQQTPWEEGTEIRNISNSGLSFTAPDVLAPRRGEAIRVQFTVPGSKQMACHARVVRIEQNAPGESLIAIEFEALNFAQQLNLVRGLKNKKFVEDTSVIELNSVDARLRKFGQRLTAVSPWRMGISLFFSTLLLLILFNFLADPNWFERFHRLLRSVLPLPYF